MQHITLKINLPNKRLDSNKFLCRRDLDTIGMMMEVVTERASAGNFNTVFLFLFFVFDFWFLILQPLQLCWSSKGSSTGYLSKQVTHCKIKDKKKIGTHRLRIWTLVIYWILVLVLVNHPFVRYHMADIHYNQEKKEKLSIFWKLFSFRYVDEFFSVVWESDLSMPYYQGFSGRSEIRSIWASLK